MTDSPTLRLAVLSFVVLMALSPLTAVAAEGLVLVGSGANRPGAGFSLAKFNSATGALTDVTYLQDAAAPGYFVFHPDGKHLYSCNETTQYQGQPGGSVSAYEVDAKTGKLTLLNQKPSSGGSPAYISLDKTGKYVLFANYNGGSVGVYPIQPDGSFGERTAFVQHTGKGATQRQNKPFAHSIIVDPSNKFALAADLGLDKVFVYKFNAADGTLAPNDPPAGEAPAGSGPRHIIFDGDGKNLYCLNEMGNTVTAFKWDGQKGELKAYQTISTLPDDFTRNSTSADIHIHPNGKFLYTSNRGHDSIAMFSIDAATGKLTSLGQIPTQGRTPRNFVFDPTGQWILVTNQGSSNSMVFKVDGTTGKLTATGAPVTVPAPLSLRFLP